ncbi:2-dehydro-3-deoxygalactonokinase [Pseudooceanicola onchidii]|uniref:2-dehydro-3-deoxygalactonokinase n=1 Tax=Pseudooceanicola onchidii TaxID=2562279 RepID=UPI0010AA8D29|nr:2-dehydro-3-deoxygalactonokinase [Pseudooceanicola onchidii]
MAWRGEIIGTDGTWGSEGAARRFVVGHPDVPADEANGPVRPERMPGSDGVLHLPALGAIPARLRLALAGFLTLNPHWDGVAVLVGGAATHWATLSAREVIHQQGSATPRIAAALGLSDVGPEAFDAALDRPERLPLLLQDAATPGAELGALMGAEVGATRTLWLGQQAVLIGAGPLARGYATALQTAHVPVTVTDLKALYQKGFEALAEAFPPDA